jgi:hypothetical protein
MTNYKLVNPLIDGNIKTSVKASSELKAAGKIYEQVLAPLHLTSIEKLNFTIEGGGNFYHYTVNESVKGDKAKFTITKFDGNVNNDKFKQQFNEIKKENQSGGKSKHRRKSKDDDDSSSSSSSDSPSYYSISRYCYSPYIYTPYITTGNFYSYQYPIFDPRYANPNTSIWFYGYI